MDKIKILKLIKRKETNKKRKKNKFKGREYLTIDVLPQHECQFKFETKFKCFIGKN